MVVGAVFRTALHACILPFVWYFLRHKKWRLSCTDLLEESITLYDVPPIGYGLRLAALDRATRFICTHNNRWFVLSRTLSWVMGGPISST